MDGCALRTVRVDELDGSQIMPKARAKCEEKRDQSDACRRTKRGPRCLMRSPHPRNRRRGAPDGGPWLGGDDPRWWPLPVRFAGSMEASMSSGRISGGREARRRSMSWPGRGVEDPGDRLSRSGFAPCRGDELTFNIRACAMRRLAQPHSWNGALNSWNAISCKRTKCRPNVRHRHCGGVEPSTGLGFYAAKNCKGEYA